MSSSLKVANRSGLNIICDDLLGGPKARVYKAFLNPPEKILYIGSCYDQGILAISVIGKRVNKDVTILTNKYSSLTDQAISNGCKVLLLKSVNLLDYPKTEYHITKGLDEEKYVPYFLESVKHFLPTNKRVWVPDIKLLSYLKGAQVVSSKEGIGSIERLTHPFWVTVFLKSEPGDWVWDMGNLTNEVEGGYNSPSLKETYKTVLFRKGLEGVLPRQAFERLIDIIQSLHIYFKKPWPNMDLIEQGYKEFITFTKESRVNLHKSDLERLTSVRVKVEKVPPLILQKDTNGYIMGNVSGVIKDALLNSLISRGWTRQEVSQSIIDYRFCGHDFMVMSLAFQDLLVKEGFTHEGMSSPLTSYLYWKGQHLHPFLPNKNCDEPFTDYNMLGKRTFITPIFSVTIQRDIVKKAVDTIHQAIKKDTPTSILMVLREELINIPSEHFVFHYIVNNPLGSIISTGQSLVYPTSVAVCLFNYKNKVNIKGLVEALQSPSDTTFKHDSEFETSYSSYKRAMTLYHFILKNTEVSDTLIKRVMGNYLCKQYSLTYTSYEAYKEQHLLDLLQGLTDLGVSLDQAEYNIIENTITQPLAPTSLNLTISFPGGDRFLIGDEFFFKGDMLTTEEQQRDLACCALRYASLLKEHHNIPANIFKHYSNSIKVEGGATPFNKNSRDYPSINYQSFFSQDRELGSLGPFYPVSDTFIFTDDITQELLNHISKSTVAVYLCTSRSLDEPFVLDLASLPNVTGLQYIQKGKLVFFNLPDINTPLLMIHFNKSHPFPSWDY